MKPAPPTQSVARRGQVLSTVLFGSRWLQVPLYLGLIIAQCVYVVHFMVELEHLVLGRDYPLPIVDHAVQRVQALALFKQARLSVIPTQPD